MSPQSDIRRPPVALLLAAHGERRTGVNAGVARIAESLRQREIVHEVAIGFVKGVPTIAESARALRAGNIAVYPLFLSEGYFTRTRLPQLLQEASGLDRQRRIRILPPLGLAPALAHAIADRLAATARGQGVLPAQVNVILLAHGSRSDPASRTAAERTARELQQYATFRSVGIALLEEPPSLREAASDLSGPVLVFGLFAGEGMHGAGDAPRLVHGLGRADAVFAGTIACLDGIVDLIATEVSRAIDDVGVFDVHRGHVRPSTAALVDTSGSR